jgi:hypothetical protein
MRFVWVYVCLCVSAVGCSVAGDEGTANRQREVTASDPCRDYLLPWGSSAGQVGLEPAADERMARGAPAIAVAPDGDLLVLDAVNGRVLALDRLGNAQLFAEVPPHSEDVAVGPDGAVAVFSRLYSRVWVFDPDGAPAGEMSITRSLRNLSNISMGMSRRIRLHNAYQDTFEVGSPALPHDEHAVLRSRREGAVLLADGRGVKARAFGNREAAMIVVRNDLGVEGERHAEQIFPAPVPADALLVAGASEGAACFRAETVDRHATTVTVDRQVVCMDTRSGRTLFQSALPPPGSYLPKHEITVGAGTVAWHHPEPHGLRVVQCEVMP